MSELIENKEPEKPSEEFLFQGIPENAQIMGLIMDKLGVDEVEIPRFDYITAEGYVSVYYDVARDSWKLKRIKE